MAPTLAQLIMAVLHDSDVDEGVIPETVNIAHDHRIARTQPEGVALFSYVAGRTMTLTVPITKGHHGVARILLQVEIER